MTALINSATINLEVKYKGTSLRELQRALGALGKAINASSFEANMERMSKALADANAEIAELKRGMVAAQNAVNAAAEQAARAQQDAAIKIANALKMQQKAEKAAAAAANAQKRAAQTAAASRVNAYNRGAEAGKKAALAAKALSVEYVENYKTAQRTAVATLLLARQQNVQEKESKEAAAAARAEVAARNAAAKAAEVQARNEVILARQQRGVERARARMERDRQNTEAYAKALFGLYRAQMLYTQGSQKSLIVEAAQSAAKLRAERAAKLLADRTKLLNLMQSQGSGFLKRNENLYLQLANTTKMTATELRNYVRLVQAAMQAEQRRYDMLRGKAKNVAGQELRGVRGFFENMMFNLSAVEQVVDPLYRASFRLQMVGNNLQQWSRQVIMWASNIMNVFGEFEYTMNRAAGALEIWDDASTKTTVGVDYLQSELIDLAAELRMFPAQEVAEALYFWGSATGQVVEDTEDLKIATTGLSTIMKAAIMTNTGYEDTIKGVYSILTQYYQGSLENATTVTEQLFLTTQKTAAEFTDLIQAFKMVGPVAAQAGTSFEQVNETFGLLADLGIRGSMAGRAMRQMFIQMVRPSGPAFEAINTRLAETLNETFKGKSWFEITFPEGKFVGIEQHFKNLAALTKELSQADRQRFLAQISTANMLPMMAALTERARRESLGLEVSQNKVADSANKAAALFERNWSRVSNSWKGVLGTMQRSIESIKIVLGSAIADAIAPFIDGINEILANIRNFISSTPGLTEVIIKLTAAFTALSGVFGVVLVATGSLIGVGTAIYFMVTAFQKWLKLFGGIVGIVGVFASAILDNFGYIMDAVDQISTNFNNAFGEIESSFDDLGGVIEAVTAPLREFAGIVVRATADILVLASNVFKLVDAFNDLTGGFALPAIITALTTIVSARLLAGFITTTLAIGKMALGLKALGGTMVTARLNMMYLADGLRAITAGAVSAGLRTVAGSLAGLLGGPVGWIAMGFAILPLLHDVPILGDLLDALGGAFQRLSAKQAESLKRFEEFAPAIEYTMDDILARLFPTESETLKQVDYVQNLIDQIMSPDINLDAKWDLERELSGIVGFDFAKQDITGLMPWALGWQSDNEKAAAIVGETAITWQDAFAQYYETFKEIQLADDSAVTLSLGKYGDMITRFMNFANFTGPEAQQGATAANIINNWLDQMPDKVTTQEAQAYFDDFVAQSKGSFSDLSFAEFTTMIASAIEVGLESSAANKPFEEMLQSALAKTDPMEIQKMLLDRTLGVGGYNISEMVQAPRWQGLRTLWEQVNQYMNDLIAEQIETGPQQLSLVSDRLKNANDMLAEQLVFDMVPDLADKAGDIEYLVAEGTTEAYEKIASILLSKLPDGRALIQAAVEGDLASASADWVALGKTVVDNQIGGDYLASIVAEKTEEAAEEAGREGRRALISGLIDGLSDTRVDMKEFKKLSKLGTLAESLGRKVRQYFRMTDWLAGHGGGNVFQRGKASEFLNEIFSDYDRSMQLAANKPARQRKLTAELLNALIPKIGSLPDTDKTRVNNLVAELFTADPAAVGRILAETAPKMLAVLKAEWLKTIPPAPTIEAGVAVLTGAGGAATGAGEAAGAVKGAAKGGGGGKARDTGVELGKRILKGIAISSEDATSTVITVINNVRNQAFSEENSRGLLLDAGKWLGGEMAKGIKDGVANNKTMMWTSIAGTVNSVSALAKPSVRAGAVGVGFAWAEGFVQGVNDAKVTITASLANAVEDSVANSPPKTGPLKEIDTWGWNAGEAWAEGLADGVSSRKAFSRVARAAHRFLDIKREMKADRNDIGFKTENNKVVTVKLEVSSPDGTVNRQKQADIRRGAMDALVVAGLEHYVTVG